MRYQYPALLIKEDNGFIVRFIDFDDVFTQGQTIMEAVENGEDVLNLMLCDKEENEFVIPKPSSLDTIDTPKDAFVLLIKADTVRYRMMLDKKTVRKNVSVPSWLNQLALRQNLNFSYLLQKALMKELNLF